MRWPMTDARVAAARALAAELGVIGARPVHMVPSTAARDWALSGAMALTGRAGGPVRLAPGGPASWVRAAAGVIGVDQALPDPAALLGERAACVGLTRNAPRSVGSAYRSPLDGDPWLAVQRWLSGLEVAKAAERAQLLGLPASVVATAAAPVLRPAVDV